MDAGRVRGNSTEIRIQGRNRELLPAGPNVTEAGKAAPKLAVLVAALGYFVDVYDLLLFSIVRIPSLRSLGYDGDELLQHGIDLLNMQMLGLLFGGVFWGIWGDKLGRVSVLFGSILLYSIANLLNGIVTSVEQYAVLRFVAGVGLAGELGAGITLVSELFSAQRRGIATTIVASVGVAGAVVAGVVAQYLDWRSAYIVGGLMGLSLLALRVSVHESGMFESASRSTARRGDIRLLFTRVRFGRFLSCIAIGVPIWFIVGILVTFSPELGIELRALSPISAGYAVMATYAGLVIGDLASGLLCQLLKSRRKVIALFLGFCAVATISLLSTHGQEPETYYLQFAVLGFCAGYWAVFITTAAEQFGTNIRATVTTTVPNFVRGAVVPMTLLFEASSARLGLIGAAYFVGFLSLCCALIGLWALEESFRKDLDFLEV